MKEFWKKIRAQAAELLGKMSPSQRISLLALMAVLVISIVLLIFWSAGDSWTRLFEEDITTDQQMEVARALEGAGIEYKDSTGQIAVNNKDRKKALAVIYQEGAKPEKKDFYKWLWEESLTENPSGREKKYIRAREQDLAEIISEMPGIQSARVMLNKVANRHILEDSMPRSTAAVALKLKRGVSTLPQQTALAISRLVAGAIDLKPNDVQITANGRYYPVYDDDSLGGYSSQQLEIKERIESSFTKKVRDAFPFLPGIVVSVNVKLKLEKEKGSRIINDPDKALAKTHEETVKSKGPGAPGYTPGVPPNIAVGSAAGLGSGGSTFESTIKTSEPVMTSEERINFERNYDLVNSVSIFVTIPMEEAIKKLPREFQKNFDEKNPEHLKALEEKKTAWMAGVEKATSAKLKDITLNLEYFSIAEPEEMTLTVSDKFGDFASSHWGEIALITLAVAALGMIALTLRRAVPAPPTMPLPAAVLAAAQAKSKDKKPEDEVELPKLEMSAREKQIDLMRDRIVEVGRKEPAHIARLIRTWLTPGA
jgi:flagellar M-ring protein FliF